jgi:heme-degrading monooxygenase HmoA
MAIGMRMRWDGATQELYDEVRKTVDWEGKPPSGLLLHTAWSVGDQLNVCDIWETPEDFNTFVETRLMPGVAQVGIPGQPEVEIHPVHNWQLEKTLTPGSVVEEDELPVDAYKALEAQVSWREEPPIGGILHVACIAGDMVRTVTAWESEADVDKFVADRLNPAAAALGFPEPPAPECFHEVHALSHPAGALTRS